MIQDPPFAIQVEATEGCNLRCTFCGLNGIRGKENNFKFMTLETAQKIASGLASAGWSSRIEFAMHGEPTMNPELPEIIRIFRENLPNNNIMLTCNGGGLLQDSVQKISDLFKAGLNTLALDEYQTIKIVPKIMARLSQYVDYDVEVPHSSGFEMDDMNIKMFIYPLSHPLGNPHQRRPIKEKRLIWIKPIDLNIKGTHATLNNHAGAGSPKNDRAAGKRCAKPFREMSFRWDGSVAICCNDWRGELPIESIHNMTPLVIWNHSVMQSARHKLYAGERDFGPCKGCDAISYRTGLLPDKFGKVKLPEPSAVDEAILKAAIQKGPLTAPVKREWEL